MSSEEDDDWEFVPEPEWELVPESKPEPEWELVQRSKWVLVQRPEWELISYPDDEVREEQPKNQNLMTRLGQLCCRTDRDSIVVQEEQPVKSSFHLLLVSLLLFLALRLLTFVEKKCKDQLVNVRKNLKSRFYPQDILRVIQEFRASIQ